MKRLSKILLTSLLAGILFINLAWSKGEERAIKAFLSHPDIKFLRDKCECGHAWVPPRGDNTFYTFNFEPEACLDRKGPCEGMGTFTFYMDAKTGKIWGDEEAQKKVLVMKEAEGRLGENIEKEKSFMEELKRAHSEIRESRFIGGDKYINLVHKYTPLFLQALNAVTADIRSEGAIILGQLAGLPESFGQYKAKEAIPKLLELLKDEEYGVRYDAVYALGNIGDRQDKNLVESILSLIKDSNSLVRRGAIGALAKLGDSSLTPVFIELVQDSSVNQETVKALMQLGDERAVNPLIELLNKKEFYYLEKDIIYALGNTGGKKSVSVLIGLLNREYTHNGKHGVDFEPCFPYMGFDAACVLAKIGKDSIPYLLETLKSEDYLNRLYSVYALSLIKDPIALGSLSEALTREENPTVKIYIEQAISEIKGEKFTPPLIELQVGVESSKQKYRAKDKIKVRLWLQNKESKSVIINTSWLGFADTAFKVIGPDGKPVAYIGPEYKRDLSPTEGNLIALAPEQTYKTDSFNLSEYYDFTVPGTYQIIGIYQNHFNAIEFGVYVWVGKIESKTILIDIE